MKKSPDRFKSRSLRLVRCNARLLVPAICADLALSADLIMKVGGWKTDSVFRRYIVDEADLHEAATVLDKKRKRHS